MRRATLLIVLATLVVGLFPPDAEARKRGKDKAAVTSADDLLIVDCLLPHKVRRLGRRSTFMVPRRPIRTTAADCRIRGGEYTEPDQVSYATSLEVWLPQAKAGDAEAQYYVGQIFEKGLGTTPDYGSAATWYGKAAEQDYGPAQVGLGYLYEEGLGVDQDDVAALNWYRKAAGLAENLVVLEEADYAALVAARDALSVKEGEVGRLEGEIEVLRQQLESLESASEEEKERQAGLRSILDRLQADLATRQEELDQGRSQIATLEKQLDDNRTAGVDAASAAVPGLSLGDMPFGSFHALVIGNSKYQQLPVLPTAAGDAELVAELLREKYGFSVELLLDATRYDIMAALNELRETLTEEDHLLVYYAGHGERDADGHTAYWQPIDAAPSSPSNWIPNEVVTEHLDVVPARHVLVVADSVYTGLRTRSSMARLPTGMTDEQRFHHIRLLLDRRSRLVLSSGTLRPQADGEIPPRSRFTRQLLDVLRSNDGILETAQLYREVNAKLSDQGASDATVELAPLRWARNDLAEFFFVPKG